MPVLQVQRVRLRLLQHVKLSIGVRLKTRPYPSPCREESNKRAANAPGEIQGPPMLATIGPVPG